MGRSPCCDKSKVKRGTWSPEEDATLKDYLHRHGTGGNWISLPHKAGLQRCGKSCRLRWLNYLRPDIKHGAFTQEEENIICNLYTTIGSRWSLIASHLPGRTDNDVKNYWNSKLKKKLMAADSNPPPISNKETPTTTTSGTAATTSAASGTTTTTTTNIDKTTIFQDPINTPPALPQVPFLHDNTGLENANAQSISYEPINFTSPRFSLEGTSNYSSANNSCPFSPSHQYSSPFRPFSLGTDESNGVKGVTIDEYSCEVLSGIWSQDEAIGADNNADLFSIFHFDSKPNGLSQSH